MYHSKVQPLKVRPGVQYACMGDGLCCHDIHAIGPLSPEEQALFEGFSPELVLFRRDEDDHVLQMGQDGRCMFLGDDGCQLHRQLGPDAKPAACSRFPLGLTATPSGGRVTTSHRCPCRTLGARPDLSAEVAEPSLRSAPDSELFADVCIEHPIALDARGAVAFDEYEPYEAQWLKALSEADDPIAALGAEPFPALAGLDWEAVGESFANTATGTRYGTALTWFGAALLSCRGRAPTQWPPTPWRGSFERAARREGTPRSAREIFADFTCDEIWSLSWSLTLTMLEKRQELATLLSVAQRIVEARIESGACESQAAAEAVMIIELAHQADSWQPVNDAFG